MPDALPLAEGCPATTRDSWAETTDGAATAFNRTHEPPIPTRARGVALAASPAVDRKLPRSTAGPTLPPVTELLDTDVRERQHPRVQANLPVQVRAPGMVRPAVAEDLSLAGLRVLGLRAPLGQALTILLPLPEDRVLTLRCTVVRQDATGVAVEYDGLDWEDLFALARYLHPRLP